MCKKLFFTVAAVLAITGTLLAAGQDEIGAVEADSNLDAFTISVSGWNLGDDPNGIITAYKDTFKAAYAETYPNATVEILNTPGETYFDVLKAQMASNSAADVVQFQTEQLALFAQAGFIADLSDMAITERITLKDPVMYDGKFYAVPFGLGAHGIWYSKALFTENNIAVPTTWDQFIEVCETFDTMGITPISGGFKDAWVAKMTAKEFLWNDYSSPDFELEVYNGTRKLAGSELEETFTKLQQLIDNEYFGKDALSNGWDLQRNGFENGKSAMIMHGPYMAGLAWLETMDEDGLNGMETGFFSIPNDDGVPVISASLNTITGINAKTADIDRAKDLVDAMHTTEAVVVRMKDAGMFPAISGIEIDYKETGNKEFLQVLGNAETVNGGRYLPGSVQDAMGRFFTKMLAGFTFDPVWLTELDETYKNDKSLVAPPQ